MKKRRELEKLSLSKKTISRIGAEVSKLVGGVQHTSHTSNQNRDGTEDCGTNEITKNRSECLDSYNLSCICGR